MRHLHLRAPDRVRPDRLHRCVRSSRRTRSERPESPAHQRRRRVLVVAIVVAGVPWSRCRSTRSPRPRREHAHRGADERRSTKRRSRSSPPRTSGIDADRGGGRRAPHGRSRPTPSSTTSSRSSSPRPRRAAYVSTHHRRRARGRGPRARRRTTSSRSGGCRRGGRRGRRSDDQPRMHGAQRAGDGRRDVAAAGRRSAAAAGAAHDRVEVADPSAASRSSTRWAAGPRLIAPIDATLDDGSPDRHRARPSSDRRIDMTTIDTALAEHARLAARAAASDVHLTAGQPPLMRVDGDLAPIPGSPTRRGRAGSRRRRRHAHAAISSTSSPRTARSTSRTPCPSRAVPRQRVPPAGEIAVALRFIADKAFEPRRARRARPSRATSR